MTHGMMREARHGISTSRVMRIDPDNMSTSDMTDEALVDELSDAIAPCFDEQGNADTLSQFVG